MSYAAHTRRVRSWFDVTVDRAALELVALFLAIQAGTVGAALWLDANAPESATTAPGGVDGPAAGAGFAILEVALAVSILGLLYALRYLPQKYRDIAKKAAGLCLILVAGAAFQAAEALGLGLVLTVTFYVAIKAIPWNRIWWVANDVLCVAVAIYVGAVLGLMLNEWAILTFIVGMTAYDIYFADKKKYMFQLADLALTYKLPVLFVRPANWRLEWDRVLEDTDGDGGWGIGSADLLIPAAFTAAVVTSSTLLLPMLAGVVVTGGVVLAALRIRHKMLSQGSGAGLPPILAGVGLAYVAVVAVSSVVGVVG